MLYVFIKLEQFHPICSDSNPIVTLITILTVSFSHKISSRKVTFLKETERETNLILSFAFSFHPLLYFHGKRSSRRGNRCQRQINAQRINNDLSLWWKTNLKLLYYYLTFGSVSTNIRWLHRLKNPFTVSDLTSFTSSLDYIYVGCTLSVVSSAHTPKKVQYRLNKAASLPETNCTQFYRIHFSGEQTV